MPYSVKGFFEIDEDMVQILLVLEVLFTQDSEVEDLFCGEMGKLNRKLTENVQKLISSPTPWSKTACRISASLLMRFFRYVVHKLVPIQNACVRNRGN